MLSTEAVTILDFCHYAEHLSEFIGLWVGPDNAEEQASHWRHRLKQERRRVFDELQRLDLTRASPAVQESHRQLCGYLAPTYVELRWEIGSGEIESARKTVVGQRLK